MRLDSLKHLARVAESLAEPERIVVLGSASLLDKFPELGDDHGGPLRHDLRCGFHSGTLDRGEWALAARHLGGS